ncbi:MAG: DUF805 domain-containing protein [Pseudomonadota bacterium]
MTDSQKTTVSPMRWLDTLFNPSGTTSKLDFTRAWTLLFFIQLSVVVIIPFVAGLIGLVGGEAGGLARLAIYASPIVFTVTTFSSYIIHTRRLRDASKPTWLAVLILVPLFIGLANFFGGISQQAATYNALYQDRELYLNDFAAYEEKQAEKAAEAEAEALLKAVEEQRQKTEREQRLAELPPCPPDPDAEDESDVAGQNERQNSGDRGPSAEDPLPDQISFILIPNLAQIQSAVIPMSALLAIWSLVFVARAPLDPRYQHERKGFVRLFFSPFGRIGERQFWFGLLAWAVMAAAIVGILLGVEQIFQSLIEKRMEEGAILESFRLLQIGTDAIQILLRVFGVIILWIFVAILIKRLHDIGKTGWRVLIPVIVAVVLFGGLQLVLILTGTQAMMHCGKPQWVGYAENGLTLVFAIVLILYFARVAFTDPDWDRNAYGDAPQKIEP